MYEAKNAFDFGSQASAGLQVKRVGKSFQELTQKDFGRYLGAIAGKYTIGLINMVGDLTGVVEEFDTEEAMKKEWKLD